MHVAWKVYLIGMACILVWLSITFVQSFNLQPEVAGYNDAPMGLLIFVIVYGISGICVWDMIRTTRKKREYRQESGLKNLDGNE